jgi:glycosyltransferase involved in cell wall biosynthesis
MPQRKERRRIKLLYVTREGFPTFRVDIKSLFGKFLPRHGIETSLIALKTDEPCYQWVRGDIISYCVNITTVTGKIADFILNIYYVWRLAPEYDAIQVRDKAFVGLFLLAIAKIRKKPIFYWMSFPFAEVDLTRTTLRSKKLNFLQIALYRLRGRMMLYVQYKMVFRLADHIFVQSSNMRRYLCEDQGVTAQKMTVVPMGIDMESVATVLQHDHISPYASDEFVIANLGVLESSFRGLVFLLDLIEDIVCEYPQVRLLLIGGSMENNEQSWIQGEIHQRRLDKIVTLTGWVDQATAWKNLKYADVGINILEKSILTETMSPTKVVEYAAFGVPSILTDIEDQKELVTACRCGIVVPYEKEKIISAIKELIENHEKRIFFSLNGKQQIHAYRGYDYLSQELAKIYKKSIE